MSDNSGKLSDVKTRRISVRIGHDLYRRLKEAVSFNSRSASGIVREALEAYLAHRPKQETCYDIARRLGVIGMIKDAPRDMSTNPKYFKDFGRK